MSDCGCLGRITDPVQHAAWHELVLAQTGIARGPVGQAELQSARGYGGIGADDHAKRERDLQSGKSSPGWRREAAR